MNKLTPVFIGKVTDGKLIIPHRKVFDEYLLNLKGDVTIEVKQWSNRRSLDQNAFYWLYLGLIASETGDNINDLHEFFKRKILPPRFTKVMGEPVKLPASTTELSKVDFGEYMEQICALTSVPIPDPNLIKS